MASTVGRELGSRGVSESNGRVSVIVLVMVAWRSLLFCGVWIVARVRLVLAATRFVVSSTVSVVGDDGGRRCFETLA